MGDILARCSLSTRVLYFFQKLDQNEGHHLILLDLRKNFYSCGSNFSIQNIFGQAFGFSFSFSIFFAENFGGFGYILR